MSNRFGLRERKKQQTKEALTKSAYELFGKRGYSRTSVESIAAHANFAPRTFFLHFASKEDLLFPDADLIKASLEAAFSNRAEDMSALQTLKRWILAIAAQKQSQNIEHIRLRKQIIDSEKSLQGREKLYLGVIETIVSREVAKDIKVGAGTIKPKIVATAAVAVFAAIDTYVGQDLSKKEAKELIDMGIDFLESGLRALKVMQ